MKYVEVLNGSKRNQQCISSNRESASYDSEDVVLYAELENGEIVKENRRSLKDVGNVQ